MLGDRFALRNKTACYNILFDAASQSLADLGKDERLLGAQTGAIAVLHTWGQNLMDHPSASSGTIRTST